MKKIKSSNASICSHALSATGLIFDSSRSSKVPSDTLAIPSSEGLPSLSWLLILTIAVVWLFLVLGRLCSSCPRKDGFTLEFREDQVASSDVSDSPTRTIIREYAIP